jgi:hypothetical protein
MGNSTSVLKTDFDSGIIYKRDVITDDDIKNSHEATVFSIIKYCKIDIPEYKEPNHLIGYNHKMTLNDLTFIKYENGTYLYRTGIYPVTTIFGGEENCDIINNIRLETENKNLKMYIEVKCCNEKTLKMYEPENFELKWINAVHYKDFRFVFITDELMPDHVCILSTKYLAYPHSFRMHIRNFSGISPLKITDMPLQPSPKQIDHSTLNEMIFKNNVPIIHYCRDEVLQRLERLVNITRESIEEIVPESIATVY